MDLCRVRDLTNERTSQLFADEVNAKLGLAAGTLVQPIRAFELGPSLSPLEVLLGLGEVSTLPGSRPRHARLQRWAPVLRHVTTFAPRSADRRLHLSPESRTLKRRSKSARNEDLSIGVAAALFRHHPSIGGHALFDVDAQPVEIVDTNGKRPDYLAIDHRGMVHAVIECKGSESSARSQCADAVEQLMATRLAPHLTWGPAPLRLVMGQEARGGYLSAVALQVDKDRLHHSAWVASWADRQRPARADQILEPEVGPGEVAVARLAWAGDPDGATPALFETEQGLEIVGTEVSLPGMASPLRLRFGLLAPAHAVLRQATPTFRDHSDRRWRDATGAPTSAGSALRQSHEAARAALRGRPGGEPPSETPDSFRGDRAESPVRWPLTGTDGATYYASATGMVLGVGAS